MVQPDSWKNCPFPVLPKEERVKSQSLAICKGCNSSKKINTIKNQLCSACGQKYRYYGSSCSVPNCDTISDGSIMFRNHQNKILCDRCYQMWVETLKSCEWDTFIEKRHLHLLRPPTFAKAWAAGLVSLVENPVKKLEIAECKNCERDMKIDNPQYQLCGTCSPKLRYYGEKCSIGGTEPCPNDAYYFDTAESRFVCTSCVHAKSGHNLLSYHFYETQIRTITECMLCSKSVAHNKAEGELFCSAHIDHDHKTGKIRGVLCTTCNLNEGKLKAWAEKLNTDLLGTIARLETYYQNCEICPTKV